MKTIDLLAMIRKTVEAATRPLDPALLTTVPEGFNNHILWQIGHISVVQQVLCYRFSGLEMPVDDSLLELFGRDTRPSNWPADAAVPTYDELIAQLHEMAARLRSDYDSGLFQEFRSYRTMAGPVLESVEDAIRFTIYHEGIHMGYILSLRRALGAGL